MFGGRFTLSRFTLPQIAEKNIRIVDYFFENIRSVVSVGQNVNIQENYRSNIQNTVTATRGINFIEHYQDNINSIILMRINFFIIENYTESIKNEIYLSSNIAVSEQYKDELEIKVFLGKNIQFDEFYSENIRNAVFLGKDTPITEAYREAIFARISSAILTKDIAIVNVSIPPGGELRIDSGLYTALLDGENILHTYNGDWIWLDRNLVDLTIDASSATMDGVIIYVERFL